MDRIAEDGWYWAHNVVKPLWETDIAAADAAYSAILIAYRAGIREGLSRTGQVPSEILFSDFDLTAQMDRFDESLSEMYSWPIARRVEP